MKTLKHDDIVSVKDIVLEEVEVPEWGGNVYVKGLTGAERDKFEASLVLERGKSRTMNLANIRAKLCVLTICDEKRERLFKSEEVQMLSQKSAAALQRVFIVARKLSKIENEDVEELAGELKEDPFDGSPSD